MAEIARDLGWDGDGDDAASIKEIDKAFALGLPRDLLHLNTVGDLWRIIEERHLAAGEHEGGCHSAMAFYRLRSAGAVHGDPMARPSAALVRPPKTSWRAYLRMLNPAAGLRMPRAFPAVGGCLGMVLIVLGAAVGYAGWAPAIGWAIAVLGVSATVFSPTSFSGKGTLGDLARAVAERNPIALHRLGGRLRRADLWTRMTTILSHETLLEPTQIGSETRFFPEREPHRRWI